MSESTNANATAPNAETFKSRFESLRSTVAACSAAFGAMLPVTGRLREVQLAAVLVVSDLKFAQRLMEIATETIDVLASFDATDADNPGKAEFVREFAITLENHFGISKETIRPSIIQDLEQQHEMLRSIIARIEANIARLAV